MSADPVLRVPSNWRNHDYTLVWAARDQRLKFLHENPHALPDIMAFYRERPAEFINDWGVVHEPRNVQRKLDAITPFMLFPKQFECIDWMMERWRAEEPGIIEKSRDSGMTWLTVALACTLCLFQKNMVVGFGSRKVGSSPEFMGLWSSGSERMEFFAGGIVVLLVRAFLNMSAKRPPVGPNVVIEQSSGTETTVLLEGVDVADQFAAEEEQVIEVSAQGCWGQLLYVDQIGDEGLELLEQTLTVGQIALVDLPGSGPPIHQAQRLGQGSAGGGVMHSRDAAGRGARTRVSSRHDAHYVTEPLLSLQGICV
jgi:hypothetical protein